MNCKGLNRQCALEPGHKGKCLRLTGAINTNEPAINSVPSEMMELARKAVAAQEADKRTPEQFAAEMAPALAGPGDEGTRTANRRDRKAYNEYMKRYMKEKRAKKPLGIPYG